MPNSMVHWAVYSIRLPPVEYFCMSTVLRGIPLDQMTTVFHAPETQGQTHSLTLQGWFHSHRGVVVGSGVVVAVGGVQFELLVWLIVSVD